MDAEQALADLTEISSQIEAAVIFDAGGKVAGSTLADPRRADELARGAAELLQRAVAVRGGDALPTQLEVATREGSVFVARDADARIVATTSPQPTVGLVFYDLKSALRQIEKAHPEPPTRRGRGKRAEQQAEPPANTQAADVKSTATDEPQATKKKRAPRKKADAP